MSASVRVTTRVDTAALNTLLVSPQGPVVADLMRRGRNVVNEAKRLCPVDRGRLRSSITAELVTVDGSPSVRIGTNVVYARYVHDGTGIYGPRGQLIRPVRAKVLAIPTRSTRPATKRRSASRAQVADGVIFRRSVKGMKPRPFLRNALPAAAR